MVLHKFLMVVASGTFFGGIIGVASGIYLAQRQKMLGTGIWYRFPRLFSAVEHYDAIEYLKKFVAASIFIALIVAPIMLASSLGGEDFLEFFMLTLLFFVVAAALGGPIGREIWESSQQKSAAASGGTAKRPQPSRKPQPEAGRPQYVIEKTVTRSKEPVVTQDDIEFILQNDYQNLFYSITGFDGASVYDEILVPWLAESTRDDDWLHTLARRNRASFVHLEHDELFQLYALSRVNDLLILPFQNGAYDGWVGPEPNITLDQYSSFMTALGMTLTESASFSPFYHEIATVHQTEDRNEPISLLKSFWPCLMLGSMMFARAGVSVSGGANLVSKQIAEKSTMYWAYFRKNRPHYDMSVGWGHNSQWATSPRLDYHIGEKFLFNVEGTFDLSKSTRDRFDDNPLTRPERIELLTNRCLITVAKPNTDLNPFSDFYSCGAL